MPPKLLISQKVVDDYGSHLAQILESSSKTLEIIEFTPGILLTPPQLDAIDVAFYSRDIWAGTIKDLLNEPSQRFWPVIDAAPNIKWIQLVSAGADHLHYQPAIARGVRVTTSAGTNAEPVAITAIAGLLMLARGFPTWIRAQQRHEWLPHQGAVVPRDLRGQTAVIVGTGHIGKKIAQVLQGFGVYTIGVRRRAEPVEHFDEVLPLAAFDTLLPKCDWLILACPLTPETRALMNTERFALMPPHTGFINVSRGEVVDEAALISALTNEKLKGAYLDVFAVEPLPAGSPLWNLPNVIISPHDATASNGNYARGVELFLRNLKAYLRDESLENEVQL